MFFGTWCVSVVSKYYRCTFGRCYLRTDVMLLYIQYIHSMYIYIYMLDMFCSLKYVERCTVIYFGLHPSLQVSDRQSYLVVSLVLCLSLGLLLCLQCCRSSSPKPNTASSALPKSSHYPSPKRFVPQKLTHLCHAMYILDGCVAWLWLCYAMRMHSTQF